MKSNAIFGRRRFAIWCRSSILTASLSFMVGPPGARRQRNPPATAQDRALLSRTTTPRRACLPSAQRGSSVAAPVVGPQEIGAEIGEARRADLAHHQVDLGAEDVDRLLDPGQSTGHRAIKRRPAEKAEIGAE